MEADVYRPSRILAPGLLFPFVLVFTGPSSINAQKIVSAGQPPAISVLDSTRDQDGLRGSVRRVKTESAKIEFKEGRQVEGPLQLVELTTYGVKGDRVENASYPNDDSPLVGREEYKYDDKGNIIEKTLRTDRGSILSREAYSYEFDKFGNWTRMVTNLLVFEDGQLKREPVEITYRTLTYYFDEAIARLTASSSASRMPDAPRPTKGDPQSLDGAGDLGGFAVLVADVSPASLESVGAPPVLTSRPSSLQTVSVKSSPNMIGEAETTKNEAPRGANVKNPISALPASSSQPNIATRSTRELASEYYETGSKQYEAGDFPSAVENLLKYVELEPESVSAYLTLGSAYLKINKDKKALAVFQQAASLDPNNMETHYGLGLTLYRLRRIRDAISAYNKAAKLAPQSAKVHYGLALAYIDLKDNNGLMAEYRIVAKLDKTLAKQIEQLFTRPDFRCRVNMLCQ
jgi:Tfp pilus assembly protein PilF